MTNSDPLVRAKEWLEDVPLCSDPMKPPVGMIRRSLVERLVVECERLRRLEARRFPIMGGPSIPWRMIAPHEGQARGNHEQSLERLAERGGLDCREAVAVLTDRKWREVRTLADPHGELLQLLEEYERVRAQQQRSDVENLLAERDALKAALRDLAECANVMCSVEREPGVSPDTVATWIKESFTSTATGLRGALQKIVDLSSDRERFVRCGPRGFAEAERIAKAALDTGPER